MSAPGSSEAINPSLLYEQHGSVVVIRINRPDQLNAISGEVRSGLFTAFERFEQDDSALVAILTSTGDKAFCAGMDLKEAAEMRQSTGKDILDLLADPFYERMRRVSVPIIAAMTERTAPKVRDLRACRNRHQSQTYLLGRWT